MLAWNLLQAPKRKQEIDQSTSLLYQKNYILHIKEKDTANRFQILDETISHTTFMLGKSIPSNYTPLSHA